MFQLAVVLTLNSKHLKSILFFGNVVQILYFLELVCGGINKFTIVRDFKLVFTLSQLQPISQVT